MKKHFFYGDVQMAKGEDGKPINIDEAIKKEQKDLDDYLQQKKERLKQL